MNMKLVITALILMVVASSLGVVNATVFHVGNLTGNIRIANNQGLTASKAAELGGACAGFYTYYGTNEGTIKTQGVLPPAGSNNYDTISNNGTESLGVKVEYNDIACQWGSGSSLNTTYSTATVKLNVTAGHWYIKDFLGFGYPNMVNSQEPSTIYVTFKVNQPLSVSGVNTANLYVYDNTTTPPTLKDTINLLNTGTYGPIQISKGQGFQLDLEIVSSSGSGSGSFTITYYVSSNSELPR
ncbi:MAG: hypothetical protein F7B59_02450 [Desulfurococcales archaeon]|nr:hypothetical protein [Desulfurococcales archaeon]